MSLDSLKFIATPIAIICYAATPCYATDYLTIEQAQKICFPNASNFQTAHVVFSNDQKEQIEALSGVPVASRAQKIWRVSGKQNENLGWFVVDYVIGKHLLIDYAVAISTDKKIKEVEILSYRESYGGEIRSKNWLTQFAGKSEASPIMLNEDISNISGATLSSRHVTEGIKRILATIDVTQK